MAASDTKKNSSISKKVVKPVKSIHIVLYSCTNCGEEIEELKLCPECNSPMKVIQVSEKFGEEADVYLEKLKKEGNWDSDNVTPKKEETDDDDDIDEDDLDAVDIPIHGVEDKVDDVEGLGDIYPDDSAVSKQKGPEDMDFMEALEKLDEEDDIEDLDDLGPDGLPEL